MFCIEVLLVSIYVIELVVVLWKVPPFVQGLCFNTTYHEQTETTIKQLLINIQKDEYKCYHCVSTYTTFEKLRELLDEQEKNITYLNELKNVRIWFNVVNMSNIVIVFFIFGGSKIITLTTMISGSLVFATLHVEEKKLQLIYDSTIMLMFSIVVGKCVYTLDCLKDALIRKVVLKLI